MTKTLKTFRNVHKLLVSMCAKYLFPVSILIELFFPSKHFQIVTHLKDMVSNFWIYLCFSCDRLGFILLRFCFTLYGYVISRTYQLCFKIARKLKLFKHKMQEKHTICDKRILYININEKLLSKQCLGFAY